MMKQIGLSFMILLTTPFAPQRSQPLPVLPVPNVEGDVSEWLPGVWDVRVYAFDGESFVRVRDYEARYEMDVLDDGGLAASQWRELFPAVEVTFYDGVYAVIRETGRGVSGELTLDLDSMTTPGGGQPVFEGVLRVEDEDGVRTYRAVWAKLRNDFYQGPL